MRPRSKRVERAGESATLAVQRASAELRSRGVDVIDLGVGEPDFATPKPVIDGAIAALESGFTKYTVTTGIPELRDAIASRYRDRGGYGPDSVTVTVGAKQALYCVFLATLDSGDEVIVPTPCWVSIPPQIRLAEATPRFVECAPENGFLPQVADIEAAIGPRTKAIFLNSPCNPSGAVLPRALLEEIAQLARTRDLMIVSDETYEHLIFGSEAYTSASEFHEILGEQLVVVSSFSKSFAMTGLRIGYVLGAPDLIRDIGKLQGHMTSNACSVAQRAALAALESGNESTTVMLEEFRARREIVLDELAKMKGVEVVPPAGAFYAFPRVATVLARTGCSGTVDLARRLLEEAHVGVVPGVAFEAEGYIRISFATSREQLVEGLSRIRSFFDA